MNKDSLHKGIKPQQLHSNKMVMEKWGQFSSPCSSIQSPVSGQFPDYPGECLALEIIYTQHSVPSLKMSKLKPQVSPPLCLAKINAR